MAWTELTIETERLRLRPFAERDKPAIAEMMSSTDVRRFLGGPVAKQQLTALAAASVGERPGVFCVADLETDQTLGSVSLGEQHAEPEVSYELMPSAWGQGLGTEAVAAFLEWFWTNNETSSIIAVTQAANTSSRRLLERLGFTFEVEFEEFEATQSRYRLTRPV